MKEVKEFIENVISLEIKARNYQNFVDRGLAKKSIDEYYSNFTEVFYDRLSIVYRDNAASKFSEKAKNFSHPRHLFKISHYKHESYGDVYACFMSIFLFDDDIANMYEMSRCFYVSKIEGELKIIKDAEIDLDTGEWVSLLGVKDIDIDNVGELISVERYLEPVDDEDGMAKYLAEE